MTSTPAPIRKRHSPANPLLPAGDERELIGRDEEATRRLQALYQAGIRSGPSVPMSDDDWAALRDNPPS